GQRQRLARELAQVEALRRALEEKLAAAAEQRARWLSVTREAATTRLNRLTEEAEELLARLRQAAREGAKAGEAVGEKTRRRLAQIRQEAGALLARTAAEAKQEDAPGPAAPPSVAPGQAAGREVPWPPRPGEPVGSRAPRQAGELMAGPPPDVMPGPPREGKSTRL